MCLVDNNNRTRVLRCTVTALAYVRNMKLFYIIRLFQEKSETTHNRCLKTSPPFWNNPNATIALPLKQRLSTQSCMAVNPSRFSVLPGKQLLSQRGMRVSTWLDYWPSRTGLMTPPCSKACFHHVRPTHCCKTTKQCLLTVRHEDCWNFSKRAPMNCSRKLTCAMQQNVYTALKHAAGFTQQCSSSSSVGPATRWLHKLLSYIGSSLIQK